MEKAQQIPCISRGSLVFFLLAIIVATFEGITRVPSSSDTFGKKHARINPVEK